MGEAVKNLPEALRKANPQVPRARIAGMRDKVVHDYMGVDFELVWTVANTLLQGLRKNVQAILDGLKNPGSGTG